MINNEKTRNPYLLNGSATHFAYEYKIFAATDLEIKKRLLDGSEQTINYPTDCSITGAGTENGGEVVLNSPGINGEILVIRRNLLKTQPFSFRNQPAFYPERHEDAYDRIVMLLQQMAEENSRSIQLPVTFTGSTSIVDLIPGYALGIAADGLSVVCVPNTGADQTADLASTTNSAKGAGMSGFTYALVYAANTVGKAIKDVMDRATALEALPSPWNTGDTKETFNATPATGWLNLAGTTIGDATSGADRANADCSALFALLWDAVANDFCPVLDSAGALSTRGATAAEDWAAHKRLTLPDRRGRVSIGAGTGVWAAVFTADAATDRITFARAYVGVQTGQALVLSNSGGALPAGLAAGTYYAIRVSDTVVQLASTLALALAGTAINITGAGTGTHTATATLSARTVGQMGGEENHASTVAEMPAHKHGIYYSGGGGAVSTLMLAQNHGGYIDNMSATGGSVAHNNVQPFVVQYVHIRL